MQETAHTEPSRCSGTCRGTSPAACDSCGVPLPRGSPGVVPLSLGQAGSAVRGCCEGSGLGALEECCLALDLNWERMLSFQVWRVWLFMSQQCHWQWCTWRAEPGVPYTAIHTCSAPCAAPDMCLKPRLQGCVGSFLSSVQNLWPLS